MTPRAGTRFLRLLAIGSLVAGAIAYPGQGDAAPAAAETVRNFCAALTNAMKNGAKLGEQGRYDELLPEIRQDFDLSYMSRLALGAAWNGLSAAQKQQATDAFARYIAATYADNFARYGGERFDVTGEQAMPYGTIVQSRIVKQDGEPPVIMNYLMRDTDGAWRIGDIYLTGTISQLANFRSQFSSVLMQNGADGLIDVLNRKSASLLASGRS